jgi:F-type H+-transporting ATPase subunit alpha
VGGNAQIKAMKKIAGPLRLEMARFREMKAFAQFASDLDDATRRQLERGYRLEELLKQGQYAPLSVSLQIVAIWAAINGYLDSLRVSDVGRFEDALYRFMGEKHPHVLRLIAEKKVLDDELEHALKAALDAFKDIFAAA